jgi:NAD(P)-dependent dehydrogenase (short-subunit alcohol dehydrogenase family)
MLSLDLLCKVIRCGALHYAAVTAGVEGSRAVTQDYPTSDFDALMAVNLRGSWLCLKHLLPLLVETGKEGAVVITSSTAGAAGGGPYTKHAHGERAAGGVDFSCSDNACVKRCITKHS